MKFYLLIKIRLQLSIKLNQDKKINKPEYIVQPLSRTTTSRSRFVSGG